MATQPHAQFEKKKENTNFSAARLSLILTAHACMHALVNHSVHISAHSEITCTCSLFYPVITNHIMHFLVLFVTTVKSTFSCLLFM